MAKRGRKRKNGVSVNTDVSNVMKNYEKMRAAFLKTSLFTMKVTMHDTENFGKINAPWTDRTGFARGQIFGYVVDSDEKKVIGRFGGNASYMKYLEYANGGKYAIVKSMIEYARIKYKELFTKITKAN